MTRYETGFLTKCAEYGLDAGTAIELMKTAAPQTEAGMYFNQALPNSVKQPGLITAGAPSFRPPIMNYRPSLNPVKNVKNLAGAAAQGARNFGENVGSFVQQGVEDAKSLPQRFSAARKGMRALGERAGGWIGRKIYGDPNT